MSRDSSLAVRMWRRIPIVLGCLLASVAVAAVATHDRPPVSTSWVSSSLLVVPPDKDPGRQARNYTVLLRNDTIVLARVAAAVGGTPETVRERLSLNEVDGTTLLRVSFRDAEAARATAGLAAFVAAVTEAPSISPAVTEGSLVLVSMDGVARAETTRQRQAWPLAAGLGLFVGLLLAIVLDRADARVDRVQDLATLGVPTTWVDPGDDTGLAAALSRWRDRVPGAGHLALVAPAGSPADTEAGAARHVLRAAAMAGLRVELLPEGAGASTTPLAAGVRRRGDHGVPLVLVPGRLGPGQQGALTAVRSDGVVLVVARRTPLRRVATAVAELESLGAPIVWCLLFPVRRAVRANAEPQSPVPTSWSRTG